MNDHTFIAHCPNTGSMDTCLKKDSDILLSYSNNKNRKLPFTLEMIKPEESWIYVNTIEVNRIIEYFLVNQNDLLKDITKEYSFLKREPKLFEHKFDFLLFNEKHKNQLQNINLKNSVYLKNHRTKDQAPLLIEIKNVTYYNNKLDCLQFPDAITKRGYKHIQLLSKLQKMGYRTMVFFVLSREEGKFFMPAYHIDPEFSKILKNYYINKGTILPIRFKYIINKISNKSFIKDFPNLVDELEFYEVNIFLNSIETIQW
ncbi:MAG: hypothetical protein KatS3mg129_0368 [Leptospiraceae bacterium]|nr:MAG: hypothetical protein KatS3mg129_0368 [Leptospiraceae bacterium]